MAESLRDLVVNLSLESGNFTKNIKSINSQIKEAESEFKAAGAGVSDFEGTLQGAQAKAEMLQKKLELQTRAVEQYSKALESAEGRMQQNYQQHEKLSKALEDARARYAEIAAAQGEGSDAAKKQAEEIKKLEGQLSSTDRALQRDADSVSRLNTQLNTARGQMEQTRRELNDTTQSIDTQSSAWQRASDRLGEFADKAKSTGGKLSNTGKNLSKYVTAPIAAVATASVAAFKEVDDGYDIIIAKTGATGEALEDLNDRFENIYTSMPVTAEEAGTAIGEVNTRFQMAGEELESVSREFLRFAKVNGVDVNSSIDSVDKMMTKFGVDTSEVSDVLGYMTWQGQQTGISMTQIMSALNTNGAALQEMGFDLQESIALIATFEANGVDAATAMTAMKKAVATAAADGKDAGTAFRETANAIKNAATETEALSIAQELFGSRGAAEMSSAIRSGRLDIEKFADSMQDYAEVVNDTFDAMQDVPDEATVALNNLKLAGAELGASLLSSAAPAVQSLIKSLQGLVDKFKQLDSGTKERIVKIGALVALIGPAMSAMGKLTTVVGSVSGALGGFAAKVASAGGGLSGLGSVLKSSPALWMALAAAVVYAGYKIYDVASGAKAARENLEAMQKVADEWASTGAKGFYATSKGLDAFGMSVSDFKRETGGTDWLSSLTEDWADELFETDETVKEYADGFKELTDGTREAIKDLKATARDAGMGDLTQQMDEDIAALDQLDTRVEQILKSAKERHLTDEELSELNDILSQKREIELKYHLVEDTSEGFEELNRNIDAARARAQAMGEDETHILQDAAKAAAEANQEATKQLNSEYDKRYAMLEYYGDKESEQYKAAAKELDDWYISERRKITEDYAGTMSKITPELLDSDTMRKAKSSMGELYTLLNQYATTAEGTAAHDEAYNQLVSFTKGLEGQEGVFADYYGMLTQVQTLLDSGMGMDEVAEALNIDPGTLLQAYSTIEQISTLLTNLDLDDTLGPLRSMFGANGSLSEEVIKIATDLDMTGAKSTWEAFAADPGSKVLTDAVVNAYGEKDGGADVSGLKPTVTATVTEISGEGKTFEIKDYSLDPVTGKISLITGEGKTIPLENYTIDPVTGKLSGVDGEGRTYTVENATVTAEATVTPKNLTSQAVLNWHSANDGKVDLTANVTATMGDMSQEEIDAINKAWDANKVKLYGVNGLPIEVDPTVPNPLDGSAIVLGMDENGVYHVSVVPKFAEINEDNKAAFKEAEKEASTNEAAQEVIGAATDFMSTVVGYMGSNPAQRVFGKSWVTGAMDAVYGFYGKAGNAVGLSKGSDIEPEEIQQVVDYISMIESARKNGATRDYFEDTQSTADFLLKLANGTDMWQDLGQNTDLLNELSATLGVASSELGDYIFELGRWVKTLEWSEDAWSSGNHGKASSDWASGEFEKVLQMSREGNYWSRTAEGQYELLELTPAEVISRYRDMAEEVQAAFDKGIFDEANIQFAKEFVEFIDKYDIEGGAKEASDKLNQALIDAGYAEITERSTEGAEKAKEAAGDNASSFSEVGLQEMAGWAAGIRAGTGLVVAAMTAAALAAQNAAKQADDTHSPSRVYRDEIGAMAIEGYAEGFEKESRKQADTIRNAMGYLQGEAQSAAMGMSGGSTSKSYNYNSTVSLAGANIYVRDKSDISAISRQIATLVKRQQAGFGNRG